jgi:serine/threonine-protein kinase
VAGAALVAALLLTYGIDRHAPDFGTPRRAAQALATTSAQPTGNSGPTTTADPGSPTPSSASSTSAAPTASGSATEATTQPPASASTTTSASGSTTVAPPTAPATTTAAPTTASPSPTIGVNVKSVTFTGFRQTGTATAAATATVTTDGTGPVTITVAWFTGEVSGQAGSQDGSVDTYQRSGSTQYTIALGHTFQGAGCYWSVQARTQPASADGGAFQQLLTRRCIIT